MKTNDYYHWMWSELDHADDLLPTIPWLVPKPKPSNNPFADDHELTRRPPRQHAPKNRSRQIMISSTREGAKWVSGPIGTSFGAPL